MALTPQAELELIEAAITRILDGTVSRVQQGPFSFETLPLSTLYERQRQLNNQIAQSGRSMFVRVEGPRREL